MKSTDYENKMVDPGKTTKRVKHDVYFTSPGGNGHYVKGDNVKQFIVTMGVDNTWSSKEIK